MAAEVDEITRLSDKLQHNMRRRGWNQQRLARLSGVSDSEISRILKQGSVPRLTNALRLARALDVSLDYLADDRQDVDASQETPNPRDRELSSASAGASSAVEPHEPELDPLTTILLRRLRQLTDKPTWDFERLSVLLSILEELGPKISAQRLLLLGGPDSAEIWPDSTPAASSPAPGLDPSRRLSSNGDGPVGSSRTA